MREDGKPLAAGTPGSPASAFPSACSFDEVGARRPTFWNQLQDLGAEHDRQLSALLTLVRELRLELNRATEGRDEVMRLRCENMELKRQMSLGPLALTNGNSSKQRVMPERAQNSIQGCHPLPSIRPRKEASQASTVLPQESLVTDNSASIMSGKEPSVVPPSSNKSAGAAPAIPDMVLRKRSMTTSLASSDGTWRERAGRLLNSAKFEGVVGALILANTVVMVFEYQYIGLQAGFVTQFPGVHEPASESWPGAAIAFKILDGLFTFIFTIELVFRFVVLRCKLFQARLNWIDIVAVFSSLLEWMLSDAPVNASVFRLVRVARLARGLAFMKLAKVQQSLNILVKCLTASMNTLFWTLCLLTMVQVVVGMACSQAAHAYIKNLNNPEDKRHELYRYFGTFSRVFVSMFEIHMANWATPCRIFMESVGEYYGSVIVFYRCAIGFSLMNVIGAVFVQQTMSVAQNDNDIMILRKQKEMDGYNEKLKSLFNALDENGDGLLCREEFSRLHADPDLKAWMSALDMSPDDLEGLFDLLDTGDGFVSMDEFLLGATRVKGLARSIDMAQLLVTVGRLEKMMEEQRGGPSSMNRAHGASPELQQELPQETPLEVQSGMSMWAKSIMGTAKS